MGVLLRNLGHFVVASPVGYLRAAARVPAVFLPSARLELPQIPVKSFPVSIFDPLGVLLRNLGHFVGYIPLALFHSLRCGTKANLAIIYI